MKKIILASQSPRRRELMANAGYTFEIIPSTMEEKVTSNIPKEVVVELSMQKARDVFYKNLTMQDILVIGADTVVSVNGKILGKPASEAEAYDMLYLLQANTHEVYTGVAFVWCDDTGEICTHSFYECTRVSCYPMTEAEIKEYIACGECMDKAGAYGIQGCFGKYIRAIEGDYNNVVGLPVSRVYHELICCRLQ